ncbi:MAG: beta-N-acetylhexosaminidase [Elusimicrobia bacterium]|nr:beta-N-acetylhexosaminidase [Elusimicrobiota bacterium]
MKVNSFCRIIRYLIILIFSAFVVQPAFCDIDDLLNKMTLEEKVGQMFMIGNLGEDLESEQSFKKYHWGNVFLGYVDIDKLTPKQIAGLSNKLQKYAEKYNGSIPLLISTDQEGGKVNRLKKGVVVYPSQKYIGNNVEPSLAKKAAFYTAVQLRAAGINTNFSPVADLNINEKSHIVKFERSFHKNPFVSAEYVVAYLKGYRKGHLVGCIKHFPGYGDVAPDPHRSMPVTYKTYEELKEGKLIPYFKAIKEKEADMIMTAHIAVPKVTGDVNLPATLSKKMISEVLRKNMGYDGIIITDDFNMGGIRKKKGVGTLAVQCINAGVDILLFVGRKEAQKSAWDEVYRAVKNGKITEERLNESVRRILKVKKKYNLFKTRYTDMENLTRSVNTPEQNNLLIELRKSKEK